MADQQQGGARLNIPPQVLAYIRIQLTGQLANAVAIGDYEGAEIIPDNHKFIIADMLLTLSANPMLETAPCEHCEQIRLDHPLDLPTGHRVCPVEPVEGKERTTFQPKTPRFVHPSAQEKRIILTGK